MALPQLLLVALAAGCYASVRRHRQRHAAHIAARAAQPVQRWEGEGGGVPAGNGQTAASKVHHDDLLASGAEPLPRGMP